MFRTKHREWMVRAELQNDEPTVRHPTATARLGDLGEPNVPRGTLGGAKSGRRDNRPSPIGDLTVQRPKCKHWRPSPTVFIGGSDRNKSKSRCRASSTTSFSTRPTRKSWQTVPKATRSAPPCTLRSDILGSMGPQQIRRIAMPADVDGTRADWRNCDARGGVSDRSAQGPARWPDAMLFHRNIVESSSWALRTPSVQPLDHSGSLTDTVLVMASAPLNQQAPSTDHRHQALLAVSEAIVSHRDLSALFHELASRLHQVVRFDYLALFLHYATSPSDAALDPLWPVGTSGRGTKVPSQPVSKHRLGTCTRLRQSSWATFPHGLRARKRIKR